MTYSLPHRGYYGYELYAVCSIRGIFKSFDISPASVHDIHYLLKDIQSQRSHCSIIANKNLQFQNS